jgi:hypothetical protein
VGTHGGGGARGYDSTHDTLMRVGGGLDGGDGRIPVR